MSKNILLQSCMYDGECGERFPMLTENPIEEIWSYVHTLRRQKNFSTQFPTTNLVFSVLVMWAMMFNAVWLQSYECIKYVMMYLTNIKLNRYVSNYLSNYIEYPQNSGKQPSS